MKLNGTCQLLVYADGTKENAETLIAASKEIVLEVNADKTKYMVMSQDQNAGQSHSMKTDNSEEFLD